RAGFREIRAHAKQWFRAPGGLHLFLAAITARVVRGGVIAESICDSFDYGRTFATTCRSEGFIHDVADSHDIVAIHLHAWNTGGNRLLRKGARGCLRFDRDGNGPAVVHDDE